jgi:FkbM family methyltransferase
MAAGIARLADLGIVPRTIIDVGASDGRWSSMALNYFPEARCVLFEPLPVHADGLKRFAAAHQGSVIIRKAVGGKVGRTHFEAHDPFGGGLIDHPMHGSIETDLTTIDVEITAMEIASPYLIKLDTHGFERSILDGAAGALPKCCALVIEAYNYHLAYSNECLLFWELCDYASRRGFRPIDIVDVMHRPYDGTFWQVDIIFVRDNWPGFQYREYV